MRRPAADLAKIRRVQLRNGPAAATPSFRERQRPELRECPVPADLARRFLTPENSYVRLYRLGPPGADGCTVIVTKELGQWHLSIAHPARLPTWDEVAFVRYKLLPGDITAAMLLPPQEAYVNIHEFCFQVVELPGGGL